MCFIGFKITKPASGRSRSGAVLVLAILREPRRPLPLSLWTSGYDFHHRLVFLFYKTIEEANEVFIPYFEFCRGS
jgi:hypothetical protein